MNRVLLKGTVTDPPCRIADLPLMPAAEHRRVAATGTAGSQGNSIQEIFEERVAAAPDAVAIVFEGEELSYGQLNARANQLANHLVGLGIRPDDLVALHVERSLDMMVGLLGVLKAGAAYVPLDPGYPADRIAYILVDSQPKAILTQVASRKNLPDNAVPILLLDADRAVLMQQPTMNLVVGGLTSSHLAYVIYTSGSTGRPKGVMVEHSSVINLWQALAVSVFGDIDRPVTVAMNAALAFDASVQCWLQLLSGHRLVIIPALARIDEPALVRLFADYKIEALDCTPAQLEVLLPAIANSTADDRPKKILVGGEAIPPDVWVRLQNTTDVEFFNVYGPTECTVDSTVARINTTALRPHIGRPIANARVYILDGHLEPVEVGTHGEIFIGGVGVARGYLNQPGLTAARFTGSPFVPGDRLYRTGDLGRWRADGNIDYLGRDDFQVKIRGYRIELGEIEQAAISHGRITSAVAVVLDHDTLGRQIALFVVADDVAGNLPKDASRRFSATGSTGLGLPPVTQAGTIDSLRRWLGKQLPVYMRPAHIHTLERLPLTQNGKVDRQKLMEWRSRIAVETSDCAPRTADEIVVATIWSDVFGLPGLGIDADFHALGGQSLLAVRIAARLRAATGLQIPLQSLFDSLTISGQAKALAAIRSEKVIEAVPALVAAARGKTCVASFAQESLWFVAQTLGASEAYHVPLVLRLEGFLNQDALSHALGSLTARHEVLRTRFCLEDGVPVQIVDAAGPFRLDRVELEAAGVGNAITRAIATSFDLASGPPVHGTLISSDAETHVLVVVLHHIVADGWSMGVLRRDLAALYTARLAGQDAPLPSLAVQYADYASWQRLALTPARRTALAAYWIRTLAGVPSLLQLPFDRPRPAVQDFSGGMVPVKLDRALSERLAAVARRRGATLTMAGLAAWSLVLSRLSGQAQVIIGLPSSGRDRVELQDLIGCFVNTLPLCVNIDLELSLAGLLDQVRGRVLDGMAHQDLGLPAIIEAVQPKREPACNPLFQTMFTFEADDEGEAASWTDLRVERLADNIAPAAKADLTLRLARIDGAIQGSLEYASALFDEATACRYAGYVAAVLSAFARDETTPLGQVRMLSEDERRTLLVDWNPTRADDAAERCVHALFEGQAASAPDAVAVVFGDEHLTYRELNVRADQLARHLLGLGVKPDDRVAICVERGLEMVVGLLGVLKAGAAYVPLDPAYPAERLAYILADSVPVAILTHRPARAAVDAAVAETEPGPSIVDLDIDAGSWVFHDHLGAGAVSPSHKNLAYVIYTSGSTGRPKGVMVEHRHIVRLFSATDSDFRFNGDDVWTLFHSFAFDFSVWEIWGALIHGGKLVIVPRLTSRSPSAFYELLNEQRVTVLNQTPSAFRQLIEAQGESRSTHHLRYVVFGGEALEERILAPWFKDARNSRTRLINMYGTTETTVHVTYSPVDPAGAQNLGGSRIGRPISDLKLYILGDRLEPVPIGAAGEMYIGGAGVARGYLNRPELTAERFIESPFVQGDRLYKSGDLARYLPDGAAVYLGRNDFQVKIRGFRIELGEIEARLASHPALREAVVLAREDSPGDKRLVAYYLPGTDAQELTIEDLRAHVSASLPDHMVPAAYVRLDAFPLTPNGKLDRRALPAPGGEAFAASPYAPPRGATEAAVAHVWSNILGIELVGRDDTFFALGGHSLLTLKAVHALRALAPALSPVDLFHHQKLADLANHIDGLVQSEGTTHHVADIRIPPNGVWPGCTVITPDMLPLASLAQDDIDRIVAATPGGVANIQDIYQLGPLQQGMLFHHLGTTRGDPYLVRTTLAFDTRQHLDAYLTALRAVIARHDSFRTAAFWEGLAEPVQVVWRNAPLIIEEVASDDPSTDVVAGLHARSDPRQIRLDLRDAPMMRLFVSQDPAHDRWVMVELAHHIITDNSSLRAFIREMRAHLAGQTAELATPPAFRDFIARARLGIGQAAHEAFFRTMLGDVDEPTAPYGLTETLSHGADLSTSGRALDPRLAGRLRAQCRVLGVSPAALFHLAWAAVLARVCGRVDVVFGTVLFGRMGSVDSAEHAIGMFINTLPIRLRIGNDTIAQSVRSTHTLLSALLRHEHAPLALIRPCTALDAGAPLFTALLNYRHDDLSESADGGWAFGEGIHVLSHDETDNYPLSLSVDDQGRGFIVTVQARAPIAVENICDLVETALEQFVLALETSPAIPARCVDVMPAEERRTLLVDWNATQADYPAESCVHELFEFQAARAPDAVALIAGGDTLTYAELNARANQLAHHLLALGVRSEFTVALCLEKSPSMVVALLATLKAGGAYVPLDPTYPPERLVRTLEDCGARILLVQPSLSAIFAAAPDAVRRVDPDVFDGPAGFQNPDRSLTGVTPSSLAYVIYTSGSTGTPKGVMVEHRQVTNLTTHYTRDARVSRADRVLQFASVAFDASVAEIFFSLWAGATLVLRYPGPAADITAFVDHLRRYGITWCDLPTAFAREWLLQIEQNPALAPPALLRHVALGGEKLDLRFASRWMNHPLTRACLISNTYGPTETTVQATIAEFDAGCGQPADDVPIGRPVPNTRIYILDGSLRPVPVGAEGELFIGGAQVARGYLNRPELTAERFIENPFVEGDRLYRTGDLARFRTDGQIDFLGRNDFQVKIRGFRIEPGEIEARLAACPGVRDVVVLAGQDPFGVTRLTAYYTTRDDSERPDSEALRGHLLAALPAYMVPTDFVALERLPLTRNGKLDRKALPAPLGRGEERGAESDVSPRGDIEIALSVLWSDLLGCGPVGRNDDFFRLGGHSLLVMRLAGRIKAVIGCDVAIRTLFDHPTIAALAPLLRRRRPGNGLAPFVRPDRVPLSFGQGRLWFLHRLEGQSDAYNIPLALRLDGVLDVPALTAALNDVVGRHEILRTRYMEADGFAYQTILAPDTPLHCVHRKKITHASLGAALDRAIAHEFDLRNEMPVRAWLFELGAGSHVLLVLFHHIAADGESIQPFLRDLGEAYVARRSGTAPDWTPLPLQYADYAIWQRRSNADAAEPDTFKPDSLAYWTMQLAGLPDQIALPTDRSRPSKPGYAGGIAPIVIGPELHRALLSLGQERHATLFMVLETGFALLLNRLGAGDDIAIGTPVAGRDHHALENLIGFFVNNFVIRTRIFANQNFESLLDCARETIIDAYEHQHVPFECVVEAINPKRILGVHPLFQVMFVFQAGDTSSLSIPGVVCTAEPIQTQVSRHDLTVSLVERRDDSGRPAGVVGTLGYRSDIFDQQGAEALARRFIRALEMVSEAPSRPVSEIVPLGAEERREILDQWSGREVALEPATLTSLFESQVAQAPNGTALVAPSQSLTYAILNSRADCVARLLIERGVRPGSIVGIALSRSHDMVVALLGILKSGAAYLPLDPDYPPQRLTTMLSDAKPACVITQQHFSDRLGDAVPKLLVDGAAWPGAPSVPASDVPRPRIQPAHPAYVIYTSGSTGVPKGVVVSHRAIVRSTAARAFYFRKPGARFLLVSSISFDSSLAVIFGALCFGATLIVARDPRDAAAICRTIADENATHLLCTPSLLGMLIEIALDTLVHLTTVILAGEACSHSLIEQCRISLPDVSLYNEYGPTEAAVWSTVAPIDADYPDNSIGKPIDNIRAYVLDEHRQPVVPGVTGELHVAGGSLADGYLGRPALTAERFVPCPWGPAGARMYRTGDLVRWQNDGNLTFLGRVDQQVKIRGFRIELGEIEAVVSTFPGIAQAAATVHEGDLGERHVVAYYVPHKDKVIANEDLRRHLKRQLPDHMMPTYFMALTSFPLSPNAKLDRQALPHPDLSVAAAAPTTPEEDIVVEVFAGVLARAPHQISVDASFFALGGHSLLATLVAVRLSKALAFDLPVHVIFEEETARRLAARISDLTNDPPRGKLRTLRALGDRPPLFCIHPASGFVQPYLTLLKHLRIDQPVFAVEARGLSDGDRLPRTIAEMSADYISQIQAFRPNGPYHLLGWSFGAIAAHAIATEMGKRGLDVGRLIMIDGQPMFERPWPADMIEAHYVHLGKRMMSYRDYQDASNDLQKTMVRRMGDIMRNNIRLSYYEPTDSFHGDTMIIKPTIADEDDLLGHEDRVDTFWKAHVSGHVTHVMAGCTHLELMSPDGVAQHGPRIDEYLDGYES